MSSNDENQNGGGDLDDDFGDFGGFEAAEPLEPNVAQAMPAGVEAAANPWVAMFPPVSSSVSVQPDLLCGQNRFPQHLDTPTTVDVAGSAVASVGSQEDSVGAPNGVATNDTFQGTGESQVQLNLDHVSLANDILDGSFRSTSSNQSNSGFSPHLPNISGLDLAQGLADDNNVGGAATAAGVVSQELEQAVQNLPVHATDNPANENRGDEEAGLVAVAEANRAAGHVVEEAEREGFDVISLQQKAEEEKAAIQKELDKQLLDNSKLTEDLTQAREVAENAKKKYEELQIKHNEELEDLRGAGHQTLAVVVEEYKELMKSTVAQQQEICERQMIERLKEESARFQDLLQQQREQFENSQKEEQNRTQSRLEEALQEMTKREKEEFESYLIEERQKTAETVKEAVQRERAAAAEEIEKVINEEKRKAKDMLEEQQESFKRQLAEEVEKNKAVLKEAIEKEQQNFKEALESVLKEERERGRAQTQEAVAATRVEMKEYIQELRQADQVQSRRQLASLDLFLESARQQLSLLMNREPDTESNDKQASES